MDLDLKNKIFFVSGSSGGIGLGIARSLLEEGSKVILNGRKKEKLIQVKDNLSKEYKEKISTVLGDINHRKTIEMVSEVASKKWGQLDGLVANVGGVKKVHGWDIEQDEWDWFVENNFSVAYNTIQPLIPLIKKSHGSIIIIGSIANIQFEVLIPFAIGSIVSLLIMPRLINFLLSQYKLNIMIFFAALIFISGVLIFPN